MSDPSKQVVDFCNKVYDDIDNDKYGFDPLLVIAIANIIINLIKAIHIIYFSKSPKNIYNFVKKRGLMMRILMKREVRKEMTEYTEEERDAVISSINNVVRDYGENEFKDLVSSIR
jgi:hypothetical protein